MAERVHHIAHAAAERLGCTEPFVLYQSPGERRHLTAQALLTERPFAVRLVGPVAAVLDDAGLAMLIGHELGHWMAEGRWANPPSIIREAWDRGASAHVVRLCTLASELTADRFALVAASGELEAAVRLEVALATFDSPRALGLRELDYLGELRRRVERGDDQIFTDGSGYPTSAFRLYATWLFWRSDIHRDLTGTGPGDLALGDVDAKLQALERVPEEEAQGVDGDVDGRRRELLLLAQVEGVGADVLVGDSAGRPLHPVHGKGPRIVVRSGTDARGGVRSYRACAVSFNKPLLADGPRSTPADRWAGEPPPASWRSKVENTRETPLLAHS